MKLRKALAAACGGALLTIGLVGLAPTAEAQNPVTGAGFTTTNPGVDGTGHCQNGNELVNCNIYDGKQYVWLNGGPSTAYVGDGSYFFAVLSPGGQPAPNDGGTSQANGELANLSDNFDAYTNRTFSVSGGAVTYAGSHDVDSNKIRLMPYADTPNPGGVYIMAICSLADGYPVNPSDCKYDAFKIKTPDEEIPPATALTVTKDADGAYDTTYSWGITKDVDKTRVEQVGGNATFNYTVKVTHDAGTDSGFAVSGTISVFNPNVDQGNVLPVSGVDVTDQLSDGTVCTVTDGSNQTLSAAKTDFAYSCDLTGLPQGQLDNTVTVTWPDQFLDNGSLLVGNHADFTFTEISFTQSQTDECIDVSDTFAGTPAGLGNVCVGDANPTTFTYAHTVPVPRYDCVSYDNTAAFTTNDTGTPGSASQTVTVCGPAKTGALTMGFWQNKNGQTIISTKGGTNCQALATWLAGFNPFKDIASKTTCGTSASLDPKGKAASSGVAGYVYEIIKAAKCSTADKTCNTMLRAQMLATALNVYFSSPALGGNQIGAPSPIGAVSIDLTKICSMIDGSGGTASCSGSFKNVSSEFGGAASLTVLAMLSYANADGTSFGNGNPVATATTGASWYLQIKAKQVNAKDAFDAINNQVAFSA